MATIVQQTNGEKTIYTSDEYKLVQQQMATMTNNVGTNTSQLVENATRFKHIWLDVIEDYGAYGDGNSHPLSSKYSTLADAQKDYPCATALTDEIDWCAIQTAINDAHNQASATQDFGGGIVYLPYGKYVINQTIKMQLYVHLWGYGEASMTNIILANGSNVPMFQDPQTAGNTQYGSNRFGIKNICFDGNGVNQTTKITAVYIENCFIGGYVHNVNIRNVYGTGLEYYADLDVQNLWISYCTDLGCLVKGGQLTGKQVFIENCYNDKTIYTGSSTTTTQKQSATLSPGIKFSGGNTSSYDKTTILGFHSESCQPAIQLVGSVMDISIIGITIAPSDGSTNRTNAIDVDSNSKNYNLYDIGIYGYTNLISQTGTAIVSGVTYLHYYGDKPSYNGSIFQNINACLTLGQSGGDLNGADKPGTLLWNPSMSAIQYLVGNSTYWKYIGLPSGIKNLTGGTSITIGFAPDQTQPDTNYSVMATPEWNSGNWWISNKTTTGFTINWTTAPSSSTNVAWQLVR